MIETVLENRPFVTTPLTGTISLTSGSPNIAGVGTDFDPEMDIGDILMFVDDAGVFRTYTIDTVTNDTTATTTENSLSAATAVSATVVKAANQTVPFFKADNAIVKSSIIRTGVPSNYIVATPGNASGISINEGVLLKSFYLRFPFQYPMADNQIELLFTYFDGGGNAIGTVTAVGPGGLLYLTNENIEIPINIYIPPPVATTTTWQIAARVSNAATSLAAADPDDPGEAVVSQVDGPDILNGLYCPVFTGIRILHGFALT